MISCWLLPLLVKTDAASFKVNLKNHSQDITKKQFQRHLKLPRCKQTLLHSTYMEEYFIFFLKRNIRPRQIDLLFSVTNAHAKKTGCIEPFY